MTRNPLTVLLLSLLLGLPTLSAAQGTGDAEQVAEAPKGLQILPAEGFDLDAYLWDKRVLLVFADTPADTRYVKQMGLLNERPQDLIARDVIVVTDTDPTANTDVRTKLRPRGFALVLVDKDGIVKLRKPSPWHTREIGRSIDKTPVRRQEIRDRNTGNTL